MLTKRASIPLTLQSARMLEPQQALSTEASTEQFTKLVKAVKRVAPKSNEFTYFVCRAIHAMEAVNIDPKTGEVIGDGRVEEDKWVSDKGLEPYCNLNGDAFPEAELLAVVGSHQDGRKRYAYESFVGRGLFVNHQSDDAEAIRGIVLDAAWDPKTKGVDILVAIDKKAYPELARQIEAGYSSSVSMGTAVQYSICSECGNKAVIEDDYCSHVKERKGLTTANGKKCYEINHGLNFIEISIVGHGADPKARVRKVIASLNHLLQKRKADIEQLSEGSSCITAQQLAALQTEIASIEDRINLLNDQKGIDNSLSMQEDIESSNAIGSTESTNMPENSDNIEELINSVQSDLTQIKDFVVSAYNNKGLDKLGEIMSTDRKGYFQGGGGLNKPDGTPYQKEDYDAIRDRKDKQMVGQGMESGATGLHPGYGLFGDEKLKLMLQRAKTSEERQKIRRALLEEVKSYWQGGGGLNDPAETPYEKEDYETVRDEKDKQMVGQGLESGSDGLHPGYGLGSDEDLKMKLQRAKLRAKFVKADTQGESYWTVYAGTEPILEATADQLYGDTLEQPNTDNAEITNWDWVSSKAYGVNLLKGIKALGFERVKEAMFGTAGLTKQAQEAPAEEEEDQVLEGLDELKQLDSEDVPVEEEKELTLDAETVSAIADEIKTKAEELAALATGGEGEEVEELSEVAEEGLESAEELEDLGEQLETAAKANKARIVTAIHSVLPEAVAEAKKILAKINQLKKKAADLLNPQEKELIDAIEAGDSNEGEEVTSGDNMGQECTACEKCECDPCECDTMGDSCMGDYAGDQPIYPGTPEYDEYKKLKGDNGSTMGTMMTAAQKEAFIIKRRAARRKVANELYNVNSYDAIKEGHPDGGTVTEAGGTPLTGDNDGAKIETETEAQAVDVEVAESKPHGELVARQNTRRKLLAKALKKEAINTQGDDGPDVSVDVTLEDVEKEDEGGPEFGTSKVKARAEARRKVVAEVDEATKQYYNEFYGQVQGGKEFAQGLTEDKTEPLVDTNTKTSKADLDNQKIKMHRAYQVALTQQKIGQIGDTEAELHEQVDRLMGMEDAGFKSFASAVENTRATKRVDTSKPLIRSAGAIQVGQNQAVSSFEDGLTKLPWS